MRIGGFKLCGLEGALSVGAAWILRTISMPFVTLRTPRTLDHPGCAPPKSSEGWSPMQMKKSKVAVSGPLVAIEIVPSLWRSPVTEVRSSGMGGNPSLPRSALMLAWMTSIFTLLFG
ncbi:MAG: hypothetical protein ABSC02_10945 [Acidobacteriota bacterium]